jgi:hypothetical protein
MAERARRPKIVHGAPGSPKGEPARRTRRRPLTRAAFYAHLWLGVVFTIALTVVSVTGILLNHKRGLGLMPEVPNEATRPIADALPIGRLADIGLAAAAQPGETPGDVGSIDRMDVRPRNGYVKVRLRDAASTEVTVDISDGRVLHVGRRGDVFLEKLHSGEIFGARYILLSDAAAVALVITLLTGYWLWLAPKLRYGPRDASVPTATAEDDA